ncbi:MAG: ATP-binding protein [Planctomycetota bacterium]
MSNHTPTGSELIASVRKRPAMYVGGTDNLGTRQILFELIGNAIDQFLAGQASSVSVRFRGDAMEVSDDGPGLPPYSDDSDDVERWFFSFHDTATATGHAPHVHLVHHGCGLVVANALAQSLEVESVREGIRWQLRFERGILQTKLRSDAGNAPSGCRYRVVVDSEIMKHALPNRSDVRSTLYESAHLFPGLRITFDDERFHAPGGLKDYIPTFARWPSIGNTFRLDAFCYNGTVEGVRINAAAIGGGQAPETQYWSWANGVRTPGNGDHQTGFRQALQDADWAPTAAMIHVIFDDPRFAGPTRDQLIAPHVCAVVREALRPQLEDYLGR